jgi:PAS domain S-box-containing protein
MRLVAANQPFIDLLKMITGTELKPGDFLLNDGIFEKEDLIFWKNQYDSVLAGKPATVEARRKEPFDMWVEITFNPILEHGHVTGAMCCSRNISERKKAEQTILQSQQMMAQAESVAHFGSWEYLLDNLDDLGQNELRWSDEVFRIFGYEPGDFVVTYHSFFGAVHPDDRDIIYHTIVNSLDTLQPFKVEHRIVKPDGSMRWVHENGQFILNKRNGKPLKIVGTVLDVTERKVAEEKLRQTEQLLNEAQLMAKVGNWNADLVKNEIYWSSGTKLIYGFPDDFQGGFEDFTSLIHPADRERVLAQIKQSELSGEAIEDEFRIIRPDGQERTLHSQTRFVMGSDGRPLRIYGIQQDITELKKAQKERFDSHEKYRQIVETAQEGIWMIDKDNRTTFVNKKMGEILGYAPAEILGKRNYDFMDEEGKAIAAQAIERRKQGLGESYEFRYITKSGQDVWTNLSTNPIFDENGQYAGALAMATDITEKKLAIEALKKSEANLRTIFEHTDEAYILLDPHFSILSFNSVASNWALAAFGQTLKEGESLIPLIAEKRRGETSKWYEEVMAGKTAEFETHYILQDKTLRWYSVRFSPIHNDSGGIFGLCLAANDVTERKNADLEREKMTAEIMQRNKDLEQFAYIVSHNLRAPVANIIGYADALQNMDLDETETNDMMQGLSVSAQKLDEVIIDLNNILQVKRDSCKNKEQVVFSKIIKDIQLSICHLVQKEKAVFRLDFSEVESVVTQKSYLYSILYNLITNSIKYRQPHLEPIIEIKSKKTPSGMALVIQDNGLGIDLNKKNGQVFGLYRRFHPQVADGKGMGLFMVKTQVETLGGKIFIESEVNKGTTFTIQFDHSEDRGHINIKQTESVNYAKS